MNLPFGKNLRQPPTMVFQKNPSLLAVALLLHFLPGCHSQPQPPLAGRVALAEGWRPMVYLVQPRSFSEIAANFMGTVVDSTPIAPDGNFAFHRPPLPEGEALVQLCVQRADSRFANQLLEGDSANYVPLLLKAGESLTISANAAQFQATFSLENPSPTNRALLRLRDVRAAATRTLSAENASSHADESRLLDHEAAMRRAQQPLMDFADTCALFWPALVAARWAAPTGDYERVPEFIVGQCNKWRARMPENQWLAQLCRAADRQKLPLLVGDFIPDFPMPMAAGDTLALRSLLGKRLTVLDIWASWCAPCRRENRDVLAPIWAKNRANGLQIVGYSIDSSPAAWRAAIAKDGATWPHASHLSGDATPFLDALRLTTIPANFLLDAEGKIVAKNLHGDALRAFVEDWLAH